MIKTIKLQNYLESMAKIDVKILIVNNLLIIDAFINQISYFYLIIYIN